MCESALSVRSSRWPSCSPSIQNDSTLSDSHTVKDIDEVGFKCGVRAAAFIQESAMIDHMGIHNPTQDTLLDNGICDANSSDSTPEECLSEEPFKCGICEAAFLQEGDLIDHMHMHSPTYDKILANNLFEGVTPGKSPNRECNTTIPENNSQTELGIVTKHAVQKSCVTDIISIALSDPPVYGPRGGKNVGKFKCDICDAAFPQKGRLIEHMRMHTGEKPYKCDFCDTRFSRKGGKRTHMRRHTGEKLFKCETCGAAFPRRSHLKAHTRIHTGEKPFKCDLCEAEFSQKGYMNTHRRIHTGEKPYECSTCKATFSRRGHLNAHILIHTGERPYKCGSCDVAFSRKEQMEAHMRLHTGEKPYKCQNCAAAFADRSNFNRHKRVHAPKHR